MGTKEKIRMFIKEGIIRLSGIIKKSKRLDKAYRNSLYSNSGLPPEFSHLDRGFDWLEHCYVPQSMQYMIDCIPCIHRLLLKFPQEKVVEFLDYGTGSGSGAQLIAMLHRSRFIQCKLKVDAMDIKPSRAAYARYVFPDIQYIVADIFEYPKEKTWDIVFCSHVIEHLQDPIPLIEELQRRARHWVVLYAPFEEKPLGTGHLHSIDSNFFERFGPESLEIIKSMAWGDPADESVQCIRVVLPGKAD